MQHLMIATSSGIVWLMLVCHFGAALIALVAGTTLGRTVEVEPRLLVASTAHERQLARRAVERFGAFPELPVRVRSRRA